MRRIDPSRSRIVLVGTPAYADDKLPDVPEVIRNVTDMRAVLTDPELGGFSAGHCVTAGWTASVAEVGGIIHRAAAEAEDLLLFYFSGHGLLGPRHRELFLGLHQTRHDQLAFTGLPFDAIRDACLDSPATSRVVILDCCFSGRAIGETLAGADEAVMGQVEVAGTYTLAASPGNRTALILPGEPYTAFTGRLLALLRDGVPGAGDTLTLGVIYQRLHAKLKAEGLPLPQQRGTETADMLGLVANRRRAPAAAPAAAAEAKLAEREAEAVATGATDLAEAARLFRAIVIDRERITGTMEPATLVARRNHAYYTGSAGDPATSATMFRALIPDMKRALGPDHHETMQAERFLAFMVGKSGDPERAVGLYRDALEHLSRVRGPDDLQTLISRRELTHYIGVATGDLAGSVASYETLIPHLARVLGADHEQTLIARREHAFAVGKNGDREAAVDLYVKLMPTMTKAFGPTHFQVLASTRELAYNWARSGRGAMAAVLYDRLIPTLRTALGPDHQQTKLAIQDSETLERFRKV
jgi:uncharacterized caspase-like protein